MDTASLSIDSELYLDINNNLDFVIKVGFVDEHRHASIQSALSSRPSFRRFRLCQILESSGGVSLNKLTRLLDPDGDHSDGSVNYYYEDCHGDDVVVKTATELLDAISQFQDDKILVLHSSLRLGPGGSARIEAPKLQRFRAKLLAISGAQWEMEKSEYSFQHLVNGRPEWSNFVAIRGIILDLTKPVVGGRFRLLFPRTIYQDFRTKLKASSSKAELEGDLTFQKLQHVYGYSAENNPPMLWSLSTDSRRDTNTPCNLFDFARCPQNCTLHSIDALFTMAAIRQPDGTESCQLTLVELCILPVASPTAEHESVQSECSPVTIAAVVAVFVVLMSILWND